MRLASLAGPTTPPLLEETIGQNLARAVQAFPQNRALVSRHQGFRVTYAELWELTTRAARALLARGIARQDRVGVWSPNRYEWVVLQYAAARVGAVLVNINPAYKTAELEYVLLKSGVRLLFHSRAFRTSEYVSMVEEVRAKCPRLEANLVFDDEWESFLAEDEEVTADALAEREGALNPNDPINIQYTSGTTGFPKGATLSHRNILNNGYLVGEGIGLTETDAICVPVPFYHCFGMVMGNLAATSHACTIVVPAEAFDAKATLEAVQAEQCTALYGVPTMFIAMLDLPDFDRFDVSSLRTGIMAGSPCPVEVMKKVRDRLHMPEVTICYGMTETSPVSTQTKLDDPIEKQCGSVGTIHPHVTVRIVDAETGDILPTGRAGELCTAGYSVMLGYDGDPDATRKAVDDDGFMHTGDLATMDDDGYVNIVGRIKDMIIRGGENVYPRELEEYLYTHPKIADAQVIGVPSEKYGEEIMAWVKPKEGATVTSEELDAFCRGRIATYKIPRWFKVVDAFPMTVTGKIQKFKMRETAIAELGLEKAAAARMA
jgi:fatty-acyl-CoA synthase